MSIWRDEADFMLDIERISEFYVSGDHNNTRNKFVFKSKQDKKHAHTPWYESDSDGETDYYSFGRGRNPAAGSRDPGTEPSHHDVMREIQMQVRSAVGNRYNNEVLESYYNVCKDDAPEDTSSAAPKEVSISYAKEMHRLKLSPTKTTDTASKKTSIAENIQNAAAKLTTQKKSPMCTPVASSSSSASNSPRKENKSNNKSKRRYGTRNPSYSAGYSSAFTSPKKEINFNSDHDFPPL